VHVAKSKLARRSGWRLAAWGMAIILGVVVLAFLAMFTSWFVVAGSRGGFDAVVRFVAHGTTTIDDFRHYPGRLLTRSRSPFHFAESPHGERVSAVVEIAPADHRRLDDVLAASKTIAFLVVKDDEILLEHYAGGHGPESLSQYFSVSKSITSALVGAAIDDGIIRSIDQAVVEFVPEYRDRGFEHLTIRHLLTMASGIAYVENDNPFGLHVPFNYTSDIERMILRFGVAREPGTQFQYKSGDVGLLALVLNRAIAPRTLTAYVQERLWEPLGMEHDGVWSVDRDDGLEKAWCCLAGTARDLAKIGRLFLSRGEWNGTRILSADWIEQSVHEGALDATTWPAEFAAAGFRNYGYLWWLLSNDEQDYLAQGKDGQFLYVNPVRNTIIVRLGRGAGGLRTSQWVAMFRFLARATDR
jgi:CubicO group peptidase (beta-lactamase class C family)